MPNPARGTLTVVSPSESFMGLMRGDDCGASSSSWPLCNSGRVAVITGQIASGTRFVQILAEMVVESHRGKTIELEVVEPRIQ